jgi:hypothetical protein
MVSINHEAFYLVYPSWAKYLYKWEALGEIFRKPLESGYLNHRDPLYWPTIGYELGTDKFQLIQGPAGNGIIKGLGQLPSSRYLWLPVLGRAADFRTLPGFPTVGFGGVSWLEEKDTDEHFLGLKKHAPTFLPQISLDHAENCGSTVYVSLAFGTKARDEETCLRFQMRCQVFGLKCNTVHSSDALPDTAKAISSPVIHHRWYCFENVSEDLGLFVAKLFYLGCAAKYESRAFKFVHLVGSFEGEPRMTRGWREYRRE